MAHESEEECKDHENMLAILSPSPQEQPSFPNLPEASPGEALVIGRGTCGTIFAYKGTAYKIGTDAKALWNDMHLTTRAYAAAKAAQEILHGGILLPRIPAIYGWIKDDETGKWWAANGQHFNDPLATLDSDDELSSTEEGLSTSPTPSPKYVFALSLIPSIPLSARAALTRQYRPISDPEFCLIRPYLGLSNRQSLMEKPENLWNFPMTLQDLIKWGVTWKGVSKIAKEMATGLAVLHWGAGVDGMDVEFVLGWVQGWMEHGDSGVAGLGFGRSEPFGISSPTALPLSLPGNLAPASKEPTADTQSIPNEPQRHSQLYILDLDKASLLDFTIPPNDPKGAVTRLLVAVTSNDPYFPNPAANKKREMGLWDIFKETYVEAAERIIESEGDSGKEKIGLPRRFVEAWEDWAKKRVDEGDGIEFGY